LNHVMMRVCKERKLKVKEADVITYSRNIETNSLLAVTGFNIVEHLPNDFKTGGSMYI